MTTKRIFAQQLINIESEEVAIQTNPNQPLTTNGFKILTEDDIELENPPNPCLCVKYCPIAEKFYAAGVSYTYTNLTCKARQNAGQILTATLRGQPANVVNGVADIDGIFFARRGLLWILSLPQFRVETCQVNGATELIYDQFSDPTGDFNLITNTIINPIWFDINGGNKSEIAYMNIYAGQPLAIVVERYDKNLNPPYEAFGLSSIIFVGSTM